MIMDNGMIKKRDIVDTLMKFFDRLLSSSKPSESDIQAAIMNICPVVNESMNNILCAPFKETEIRKALFEMHPSKAPGPDGFTALFFKKNWTYVGK